MSAPLILRSSGSFPLPMLVCMIESHFDACQTEEGSKNTFPTHPPPSLSVLYTLQAWRPRCRPRTFKTSFTLLLLPRQFSSPTTLYQNLAQYAAHYPPPTAAPASPGNDTSPSSTPASSQTPTASKPPLEPVWRIQAPTTPDVDAKARKRRLNAEAARRSRQRKEESVKALEQALESVTKERNALKIEVECQKKQVELYKEAAQKWKEVAENNKAA
ncbi:hypothetical protein BDD12DRAFT_832765 [Trichophaea hybrida]|nr:hypothetical protein BDD12DRAFT_832765 [Trichophaea hybrida]